MKKTCALILATLLLAASAGCASETLIAPGDPSITIAPDTSGSTLKEEADVVGILLPGGDRWQSEGVYMADRFVDAGYGANMQFANDGAEQAAQIESVVSNGCKVLVIAPVDQAALTEALTQAAQVNVAVVAYDRMIDHSGAVKYYVGFEASSTGVLFGEYLRDALALDSAQQTRYIELFAGADTPGLMEGAMSVLAPYLQSGVLKVLSGETEEKQFGIPVTPEDAQERMARLIEQCSYGPGGAQLDAVLSTDDVLSEGIIKALAGAGYTQGQFPLVTGQGCVRAAVQDILAGKQSMSVFKDTRVLAAQAVKMADAIIKGGQPDINNGVPFSDGTGAALTYYCEGLVVTQGNCESVLFNSSYYDKADFLP